MTKTGPKPDTLKIDGDWKDAVKKVLAKPRPEGGWPEPPNIQRRAPGGGRKKATKTTRRKSR